MTFTHPSRRLVATLSVAALLVAGSACSASGDDDAGTPTTAATTGGDDPTTTVGGDETTTTTGGTSGGDDLESLLPTVDDLPDGYREVFDDDGGNDDTDDLDDELEAACPDASRLAEILDDGDTNDDDGDVSVKFATSSNQEIEIEIRPSNDRDVPVDEFIDAINACDVIETETNGYPATIDLSAASSDLGDEAMQFGMEMTIEVDGRTVEVQFGALQFRRDGIAVEVTVSSGLEDDGTPVPGDFDAGEELAKAIDEAIGSR
jgi:hypothetical protein